MRSINGWGKMVLIACIMRLHCRGMPFLQRCALVLLHYMLYHTIISSCYHMRSILPLYKMILAVWNSWLSKLTWNQLLMQHNVDRFSMHLANVSGSTIRWTHWWGNVLFVMLLVNWTCVCTRFCWLLAERIDWFRLGRIIGCVSIIDYWIR